MLKIPNLKSKQSKNTAIFGGIIGVGIMSYVAENYPEYNPIVFIKNLLKK